MMMISLRRSQSKPQEICLSFPCFSIPTPMLTPTPPCPGQSSPGVGGEGTTYPQQTCSLPGVRGSAWPRLRAQGGEEQ